MSKETKSGTTSGSSPAAKTTASTEIDSKINAENAQGFRGVEVDSTPNENYTVAGVNAGLPTPETDVESAKQVRQETGLGLSALEASQREKDAGGKK